MIVHKNLKSGKSFIYIKDIDWDKFQVITPLNQIKVVERHLFSDEIEDSNQEFLAKGMISADQLKVYDDYQRNRKEDLRDFNVSPTTQVDLLRIKRGQQRRTVELPKFVRRGRKMKSIEIDEEVYALLQKKAIPFEEPTPNHVIRRLLGLDGKLPPKPKPVKTIIRKPSGSKAPKADLAVLVQHGFLKEGQRLHFNHTGAPLSKRYEAHISGNHLVYEGALHTMSGLVADILDQEGCGIPSRAYRGPEYWCIENGNSVRQLWESFLNSAGI